MAKSITRESICVALERCVSRSQPPERSGPIYPHYKGIVCDAVSDYPPHTRMPSVRELSKRLNISLVTAQRVVTGLVSDGILYSRSRAGVFVADTSENGHLSKDLSKNQSSEKIGEGRTNAQTSEGSISNFEARFTFGTTSSMDFQRSIWQGLVEQFQKRYPNTRLDLKYYTNQATETPNLDVYERLDWNVEWAGDEKQVLNLRKNALGNISERSTPEGLLPLYYRSNFVFFNSDVLEQCGIPTPTYQDFESQFLYFKEVSVQLAAHGYDPRPNTSQQPITLMGSRHLEQYFNLVYNKRQDADELQSYIKVFGAVLKFCRLYQRAPGSNNPLSTEDKIRFLSGRYSPFYLGHSVDYWLFQGSPKSFTMDCYPIISSDESLFMWPMVGVVNQSTQHPIEAIRFLNFLIGDEAQQEFVKSGVYAAKIQTPITPQTSMNPDILSRLLHRSHPTRLTSPELFYLAINILNNELWHALLDHVSDEDAAMEALQMGKVYVRKGTH